MLENTSANRLKEALNDSKLKQQELSELSGVSKANISNYINGKRKPSNITSQQLAKVLKVNPLWLMGFDVPKYEKKDIREVIFPSGYEEFLERNFAAHTFSFSPTDTISIDYDNYSFKKTHNHEFDYIYKKSLDDTLRYQEKHPERIINRQVKKVKYEPISYSMSRHSNYPDEVDVNVNLFQEFIFKNIIIRILLSKIDDMDIDKFYEIREMSKKYKNNYMDEFLERMIK